MNSLTMADSLTQPSKPSALLWPFILLIGVVIYFGFPCLGGERLDFWFQSFFWQGQAWMIPHDSVWGDVLAYKGPKALIIFFAVYLIFVAKPQKLLVSRNNSLPSAFLNSVLVRLAIYLLDGISNLPFFSPSWLNRRRALYALACMALVPIISTQLRAVSHMATPLELKMYGGVHEHLLLFQAKPAGYPCHAFPAGHASGGFALMCLYWTWADRSYRRLGLVIGLGVGGLMGLYQIARGEHFLSHTLATALIAWLVSVCLARWIEPTRPS